MTLEGSSRPRPLLIAHARWILLTTAAVLLGAWVYQVSRAPVYTSQASVVLDSTTPLTAAMGTEKQVAMSGVVLSRAAGTLGTDEHELSQRVSATVPPDASVVNISCKARTAALAQRCAQAVADSYVAYRNTPSSISGAGRSSLRARVTTSADLPTEATRTPLAVLLGVGLVAGLSLGVATAYLRDMQDDALRDADDLGNRSGLPVLPLVPREADADAFRALRVQLHALAGGLHGRRVLVAPVGPGTSDGNVAAGLAVAFARTGASVVLVDADLRAPGLHRHVVLPASDPDNPGLTGLLHGLARPGEVRQETTVTGLSLVTAGPVEENAADLMVPEALAAALDKLRGRADLVVVRSGPVLATADTVALASAADVCLLVAEIGRTKRRAVQRAVGALPRRPDLLVAAVPMEPGARSSSAVTPRHAVKPSPDAPLPSATVSANGSHVPQGDLSARSLSRAGRDEASLPCFDEVVSGRATARGGHPPHLDEPLHGASADGPGAVDAPVTEATGTGSVRDPGVQDPTGQDGAGPEPAGEDQVERDEPGRDEPDSDKGNVGEGKTARPDLKGVG